MPPIVALGQDLVDHALVQLGTRHADQHLLIGGVIFSLTLPMTRIVVQEVHPLLNGLGRALVAAIPAALLLAWRREKWPTWPQMKSLAVVSLGVIIAFPVFSRRGP